MSARDIASICLLNIAVLAFASLIGYTIYCVIKMKKKEDFPIAPYIVIFVISTLNSVGCAINLALI